MPLWTGSKMWPEQVGFPLTTQHVQADEQPLGQRAIIVFTVIGFTGGIAVLLLLISVIVIVIKVLSLTNRRHRLKCGDVGMTIN